MTHHTEQFSTICFFIVLKVLQRRLVQDAWGQSIHSHPMLHGWYLMNSYAHEIFPQAILQKGLPQIHAGRAAAIYQDRLAACTT